MEAPTYDQIAAGIDRYVASRGIDGATTAAHVTRSTVATCKLEEAARLLLLLADDDVRHLHKERARQFVQNLTTGER